VTPMAAALPVMATTSTRKNVPISSVIYFCILV